MGSVGHSKPPEGAIVGESVPKGSEPEQYERERIERVKNTLKAKSPAFQQLSESELEERAKQFIDRYMED